MPNGEICIRRGFTGREGLQTRLRHRYNEEGGHKGNYLAKVPAGSASERRSSHAYRQGRHLNWWSISLRSQEIVQSRNHEDGTTSKAAAEGFRLLPEPGSLLVRIRGS